MTKIKWDFHRNHSNVRLFYIWTWLVVQNKSWKVLEKVESSIQIKVNERFKCIFGKILKALVKGMVFSVIPPPILNLRCLFLKYTHSLYPRSAFRSVETLLWKKVLILFKFIKGRVVGWLKNFLLFKLNKILISMNWRITIYISRIWKEISKKYLQYWKWTTQYIKFEKVTTQEIQAQKRDKMIKKNSVFHMIRWLLFCILFTRCVIRWNIFCSPKVRML